MNTTYQYKKEPLLTQPSQFSKDDKHHQHPFPDHQKLDTGIREVKIGQTLTQVNVDGTYQKRPDSYLPNSYEHDDKLVDQMSEDSFPSSDPPSRY